MRLPRIFLHTSLMALLACPAPVLAVPIQVQLSGVVVKPGTITLQDHARLSDAALAAEPTPQAYMLGAAWLRPGLLESQQRLKTGVLFDLTSLRQHAQERGKQDLATIAGAMAAWIKSLPVTGRQSALLDPRAVEVTPSQNLPLANGDRLYYPSRPDSIRIVGAVRQACTLPLVPLKDARLYLPDCTSTQLADLDWIYVIEPDGHVFRQGIALWNRTESLLLAPGATIYVPLREHMVDAINPTLNRDVADFLATQVLSGTGATP